MHDGMPYGRIQGQGQGHEPLKVCIPSIFKTYLLRHLQWELASDARRNVRVYSTIKDLKSPLKGSRPSVPHGTNFYGCIFRR